MKIGILKSASRAWSEAVAFYEEKCSGLGRRFDEAIRKAFDYLGDHPLGAPKVRAQIQRKRVPGWPFSVLYEVVRDELLVAAVMHERRQPS